MFLLLFFKKLSVQVATHTKMKLWKMASSRSASKSKCRSRKRNNTSTVKRNRCHNKARTKPMKDKYNIPVPEGENSNATIHRDQTNHVTISISNDVPINEAVDMSVCKSDQVVVHTASTSKQAHIALLLQGIQKEKNKVVEDSSEIKGFSQVAAMCIDPQHAGSSSKWRVMRSQKSKIIGEAEYPSINLGIDLQSNVSYIDLDDWILLTEDDMKINDKNADGEVLESRKADDTIEHTKKKSVPDQLWNAVMQDAFIPIQNHLQNCWMMIWYLLKKI
ncbi:Uncharacterized protein Fot_14695 [Forsythia ovata]|uniref:Uncharacterized protein n=1 Tax=Forsythia ovata TaxID=205694 RepID=A0ABD1W7B8_9LAMI